MAYSDRLRIDVARKLQTAVEDITQAMDLLKRGETDAAGAVTNALSALRAADRGAYDWADQVDKERRA